MASLASADLGMHAGHVRGRWVSRLFELRARIAAARKARRDFEALRGASDHLLRDIGITRAQLDHALATPFWADPGARLRRRAS